MLLNALTLAAALVQAPVAAPITADDLSWMAGYWLACDDGREVSETWSDPRGGLMLGSGLTVENGRASFEFTRIAPVRAGQAGVGYHAQPEGDAAVVFPAVAASGTRVVFENLGHDFPQRVIYERAGDLLTARIEGRIGEREQAMDWRLAKATLNARCPS
jgi:hypothetical protein